MRENQTGEYVTCSRNQKKIKAKNPCPTSIFCNEQKAFLIRFLIRFENIINLFN